MKFPEECARTYQPAKVLAQGASGAVWEATHRRLGSPAAVKVFLGGQDEFSSQRFLDEARVTAQFDHPSIVKVLELGLAEEHPWIAYELLPGPTLRAWIDEGSHTLKQVLDAAECVASALEHAHAAGVIHRDIKPENVLATGTGRWKVADFGIAKWSGAQVHTRTGVILGTPTYLAPESVDGNKLSPAVDVYALGVMLFEMLEGKPPFTGAHPVEILTHHLETPVPRMERADVPDRVRRLVDRLLAKDPAARPDAGTVRADLALTASGRHTRPGATRVVTRAPLSVPTPRPRHPLWIAGVTGALLAGALWMALRPPPPPPPSPPASATDEPESRREAVEALLARLATLSQDAEKSYNVRPTEAPQLEQRVSTGLAQALELVEGLDQHPQSPLSRVRAQALLTAIQVGFLRDSGGVRDGTFERMRALWRDRGDDLMERFLRLEHAVAAPADAARVPAWLAALRAAADKLDAANLRFVSMLLGQRYVEGLAPATAASARDSRLAGLHGHFASYRTMGLSAALAEASKAALQEVFRREPARNLELGMAAKSANVEEELVRKYAHELAILQPVRARTERLLAELERELPVMLFHPDISMADRVNSVYTLRGELRCAYRLRLDCGRVLAGLRVLSGEPRWAHAMALAWAQLYAADPGWKRSALDASERLVAAHPPATVAAGEVQLWSLGVLALLDCAANQPFDATLAARADDAFRATRMGFQKPVVLKAPAAELARTLEIVVGEVRAAEGELNLSASSAPGPASARPSPAPSAAR